MKLRRKAGDIDGIEPERQDFARQGAAGDDEDFARGLPAAGRLRLGVNVIELRASCHCREVGLEAVEYAPVDRVVARRATAASCSASNHDRM